MKAVQRQAAKENNAGLDEIIKLLKEDEGSVISSDSLRSPAPSSIDDRRNSINSNGTEVTATIKDKWTAKGLKCPKCNQVTGEKLNIHLTTHYQ